MDATGRVIVVTGGARGIGRALAKRFASAGAEAVVVADIDLDEARVVAGEIDGEALRCDVSRESDVKELVDRVEADHGRIDVFCSNAGIGVGCGPEATDEQWQRIWEVNLMSHVFVARYALPSMLQRGEGYLLGTVSAAGLLNHVFSAPYGVTKAAALSLLERLSIAHGSQAIRGSCLCPQGLKTDMRAAERKLVLNFLTESALEPDAVAEIVLQGIHDEKFLILPPPEVADYFRRKAEDYDRWLRGMRRMRVSITPTSH